MACFIVSAMEAAVVTVAKKVVEKSEAKKAEKSEKTGEELSVKIPFSKKLGWLSSMLWGGSALLMFEHVWHGEVVPWYPFLTAMSNPEDATEMFHEMATVGVSMAVLVTVVWAFICIGADHLAKKKPDAVKSEN